MTILFVSSTTAVEKKYIGLQAAEISMLKEVETWYFSYFIYVLSAFSTKLKAVLSQILSIRVFNFSLLFYTTLEPVKLDSHNGIILKNVNFKKMG